MFSKPANSNTENCIKKEEKKILYSGNWKRHILKVTNCIAFLSRQTPHRGGVGRSSGSWSADPQGPGITGYIDGNTAERAPSDPHWEKQTPLRRAKSS